MAVENLSFRDAVKVVEHSYSEITASAIPTKEPSSSNLRSLFNSKQSFPPLKATKRRLFDSPSLLDLRKKHAEIVKPSPIPIKDGCCLSNQNVDKNNVNLEFDISILTNIFCQVFASCASVFSGSISNLDNESNRKLIADKLLEILNG
ncbi:hypothetical protein WA026_009845, partial [Henosepilachna vigintioctopunctata]